MNPTKWQTRVLGIPEEFDVVALAGRGCGKTAVAFLLLARHAAVAGNRCRALFLRRTRTALKDAVATASEVFFAADPNLGYNQQEQIFRFSNGATVSLGEIDGEPAVRKWTGASLSMIVVDEAQQHSSPLLIDKLYASLRLKPARMVLLGHGGDVGDVWLQHRYITDGAEPWAPFTCKATKRETVRVAGNYQSNPHLPDNYEDTLLAACGGDEALLAAWRDGDVHVGSGAYFAGVNLDAATIEPWPTPRERIWWAGARDRKWQFYLGVDWGTYAPAACELIAEAPGNDLGADGRPYHAGTLIAIDEVDTARPDDPTRGTGMSAYEFANRVANMCDLWGVKPEGSCDPAMAANLGHGASIIEEFKAGGVYLKGAKKIPRPEGWQLIRERLSSAVTEDRPGLFMTRRCRRLLETIATIRRDPYRPEDLDTNGLDHWLDALRYGVLSGHKIDDGAAHFAL